MCVIALRALRRLLCRQKRVLSALSVLHESEEFFHPHRIAHAVSPCKGRPLKEHWHLTTDSVWLHYVDDTCAFHV